MLKLLTNGFSLRVYVCLNLAFSVAFSTVPTVANISLTCHDFKNVLYWNYSAPDPKPEFTITIRGYQSEEITVYTNQTYLELSKYTQDAGDVYYIQVEGKSSDNVSKGFSFSYNENLPSDIKCWMDLPKINVSILQRKVKLSFTHPYYVHNLEALKYEFEVTIYYNKTERYSTFCYDDEDVCTVEFQLSESLYGNCMDVQIDGSVDGIRAKTDSRKVCVHGAPHTKDWTLILTIFLCSAIGLLFLIIIGVIMFRKLTRPQFHHTLFNHLQSIVKSNPVHVPEQLSVSEVTSVGHTPLLTTDQFFPVTCSPEHEESSDIPTHFPFKETLPNEQGNEEVTEEPEFNDSGNSFSGYDSKKLPIDMGQGDIVEGYGPREP